MLNYDEEVKKFQPSLEVEDIEGAVYQEDLSDMTDIIREMMPMNSLKNSMAEVFPRYMDR